MFSHPIFKAVLIVTLILMSLPALASDGTAYTATAVIILVLGSFILMNLVLNGLFYFAGKYSSKRFSQAHTLISLVLPALALVWTLLQHVGFADLAINIGLIIIAVGLALLPMQLCLRQKEQHANTGIFLALGTVGFLGLSYWIQPIALFAMATAHVALISKVSTQIRIFSVITLISGYAIIGNWGLQTFQAFTQ